MAKMHLSPNEWDGEAAVEENVEQVAPVGFGLTEQQLTEHIEAQKVRHEMRQEWAQWQNQGWYEW